MRPAALCAYPTHHALLGCLFLLLPPQNTVVAEAFAWAQTMRDRAHPFHLFLFACFFARRFARPYASCFLHPYASCFALSSLVKQLNIAPKTFEVCRMQEAIHGF